MRSLPAGSSRRRPPRERPQPAPGGPGPGELRPPPASPGSGGRAPSGRQEVNGKRRHLPPTPQRRSRLLQQQQQQRVTSARLSRAEPSRAALRWPQGSRGGGWRPPWLPAGPPPARGDIGRGRQRWGRQERRARSQPHLSLPPGRDPAARALHFLWPAAALLEAPDYK
ncbi:uncharacterized protein LOC135298731 [Passer domesticus]|uniref:uncharacterized protein LOC135298731 n=1 Tax=Passer domesticus TaxID=48849 RepID=UPI0030FE849E